METITGKKTEYLDLSGLQQKLSAYREVWIDIGTGDGRFVLHTARNHPDILVIGIDACRENLVDASRRAPENALFVIANAFDLPSDLRGLASRLTINFPWGSLLEGLLSADPQLLAGLWALAKPGVYVDIRLNNSALAEAGWSLEDGGRQVYQTLASAGFRVRPPTRLTSADLRGCPTTWAKRLAYGRSPYAMHLHS